MRQPISGPPPLNNASVWQRTPPIPANEADWDLVYDTNVNGIMLCSTAAAPTMIQRRLGKIVNTVCPCATETDMAELIRAAEPTSERSPFDHSDDVAAEVLKLLTPFDDTATGGVVAMGPIESVFGIPVR